MAVTQKEIAQRLNVSQAHVGRALSGRTTGRSAVSEETRLRIQEVAREMGYDVDANREARTLVGRRRSQRVRTGVIGVAISAPSGAVLRSMPFYAPFLEGIEEEAASLGIDVCVILKRYKEVPKLMRGRDLDGVIVSGFTMDQLPLMQEAGLVFVTYQVQCDDVPCVRPDDHAGIYGATRHLLELGHRNIAFLGTLSYGDSAKVVALRLQGYRDALAEFGVPFREEWSETSLMHPQTMGNVYCSDCGNCAACLGWDRLKLSSGVDSKGRPPFTAVVCYNDPIAMGLIQQAKKDGLSVPHDLSVTGFDAISEQYHFEPRITSVACSHFDLGRSALRLLNNSIEKAHARADNAATSNEQLVFPVTLEVGDSTAAPRSTP